MKNGLSPQYMREHFIPQDGVHIYNTRFNSKGAFVIQKVKHIVLNHSATTGVHYGTHYHILLVKIQTYLILKLL